MHHTHLSPALHPSHPSLAQVPTLHNTCLQTHCIPLQIHLPGYQVLFHTVIGLCPRHTKTGTFVTCPPLHHNHDQHQCLQWLRNFHHSIFASSLVTFPSVLDVAVSILSLQCPPMISAYNIVNRDHLLHQEAPLNQSFLQHTIMWVWCACSKSGPVFHLRLEHCTWSLSKAGTMSTWPTCSFRLSPCVVYVIPACSWM